MAYLANVSFANLTLMLVIVTVPWLCLLKIVSGNNNGCSYDSSTSMGFISLLNGAVGAGKMISPVSLKCN